MKPVWIVGSMVCLSLLSSGCKTNGSMPKDVAGQGATLQAMHAAIAQESSEIDRRQQGDKSSAESVKDDPTKYPSWQRTTQELKRDGHLLAAGSPDRDLHGQLSREAERVKARNDQVRALETIAPPMSPMPVLPKYDRLTDIMVSLEMDKVDARQALRALAKQTNLNLLLDPTVLEEAPLITVSFQRVSAATVLREVLQLADLYGEIEENVLRVLPFQEVVIPLNFLETKVVSTFNSGGDVLGANSESKGSLSGEFSMKGTSDSNNPYDPIEKALHALISEKNGFFQLNRQTGTLFMRAKPSAIKSVTDLVHRYKEILSRQILIEARILEVTLSDQYQAGINWALLRSNVAMTSGITQALGSLAIPQGAVFTDGVRAAIPSLTLAVPTTAATTSAQGLSGAKAAGFGLALGGDKGMMFVDLLKQFGDVRTLSNPTIRARHAQPAMISVGQSVTYVKTRTRDADTVVNNAVVPGRVTDTPATLFDGVMLGVVPFISSEGKITLSVHPIQSSLVAGTEEVKGTDTISRPKVNLKEISTILELRDQDTVLLGGLIDKTGSKYRTGTPILSEIPILGRIFTHDQEMTAARELVIMMRVSIL